MKCVVCYVSAITAAVLFLVVSVLPASAQGRTAVLYVGGIGSDYTHTRDEFWFLETDLNNAGYPIGDQYVFSYDPTTTNYDPQLTCQPIETSAAQLVDTMRWLRETQGYSQVVLVGHSLGGLLAALATGSPYNQQAQFVRSIVTFDSPILGVGTGRSFIGVIGESVGYGLQCEAAIGELERVNQAWLSGAFRIPQVPNAPVLTIANRADTVVPLISQTGGNMAQHWEVTLYNGTGLFNHSAALHSAVLMADVADWISARAQ